VPHGHRRPCAGARRQRRGSNEAARKGGLHLWWGLWALGCSAAWTPAISRRAADHHIIRPVPVLLSPQQVSIACAGLHALRPLTLPPAGKVQVVAVHGRRNVTGANATAPLQWHEHQVNLQLKSGELRRLLFPVDAPEVWRRGARRSAPAAATAPCAPGVHCQCLLGGEAQQHGQEAAGEGRGAVASSCSRAWRSCGHIFTASAPRVAAAATAPANTTDLPAPGQDASLGLSRVRQGPAPR
jgi:hypothetical protein